LEAPEWDRPPVWFHGDLPGNLIAKDGRLVGVIDSGYGTGDPACDLLPGWTFFRGGSRQLFFDEVGLDDATITRARGFALAPAFIGVTYYKDVPALRANAIHALESALA
jgi:aminoglycoside phosphotransferase (APT) family kinase protein